jgi:hypothetical protein
MNLEILLLHLLMRALGGFLCGGLLYAGVALIRSTNGEGGSRPAWSVIGWVFIAVAMFIFLYTLGLLGQLSILFTYWSRLPESYFLISVLPPLFVSAVAAILGFIWGRRVYQKQYQATLEGRVSWPGEGVVST